MQIVDNKVLVVRTRRPHLVTEKIKKSKIIGWLPEGLHDVAVYFGLKEAQQLTSLKIKNVPSTINRDYNWPGQFKPFNHQKETAAFLTLRKKAFCFNEQGTGKTAAVIWASDYLLKIKAIRRVLIICPLSIMKSAWQQDLFKFAVHRSCDVAYGKREQRAKVIGSDVEFVIINFDGVEIVKKEIADGEFDLIVVDEASAYKNIQTNRWKTLKSLVTPDTWLWMLTGTPAAQSPVDAFGLAKLINPEGTPKFYGQFRDKVMEKVGQFRWIPRRDAETTVHNALQPAIRFEKAQCLDLPAVTHVERDAPLTAQQNKYYNMLKQMMIMEAGGEEVTSVNAAVQLNKLLQISGGAVYSDTKEIIEFDVSNRLNVVQEVIEEASHKVLVFVPFTHTINLLKEHLTKAGITCDVISGQVTVNRRHEIIQKFQSQQEPKVLIIQPQAASHGLTLTAADTIIWYAPVTSVETYLQANARIDRPGQKNTMTIVHIKGSEVEARMYRMLRGNIANHTKIIDLYKQELGEK
jgi:superfamily II DNA or RNA helicase